ncbi:hypothetical protein [Micromonospora terminaliae]|uniref:hypothetical protein n=1 Tax=Micromonospora terminaliae TaxID=1914461 RepID=UPI0019536DD3|nr:hypothetical protein [Micromonospora terminaliae]
MRTLFDGGVGVHYGQFYVTTDDLAEMTEAFAGQSNGLCGAGVPGTLFLLTGTHTGTVDLRVEWHDHEPPAPGDAWEEVVEVSYAPSTPTVHLTEWAGERSRPLELGGEGGGYRVRYCATGLMEAPHTRFGEPTPDRYLLQFWPDDPARPDVVLRQTTTAAAYWHDYARSLPPVPEEAAERERHARAERDQSGDGSSRSRL